MRALFLLVLLTLSLPSAAQSLNRPRTNVSAWMNAQGLAVNGSVTATEGRMDSLDVTGTTNLNRLQVRGTSSFASRPTGVHLGASHTRAAVLALTTLNTWVPLATLSLPDAKVTDACQPTQAPQGPHMASLDLRCRVTADGSIALEGRVSVALTLPAGVYGVLVSGPST